MIGNRRDPSAVSPTAHYTGHVWTRNGLSPAELATLEGRVMFDALRPAMVVAGALGGVTLEGYLLARHRALDALLVSAIEDSGVGQVVEIAAGMSGRGWRMTRRFAELTYVEADLPDMAARKRTALARLGDQPDRHRVVTVDVLARTGPETLEIRLGDLDPGRGLVVIAEGLLSYLSRAQVEALWARLAVALRAFDPGLHLADLSLRGDGPTLIVRGFRLALAAFTRGGVHLHYSRREEAEAALLAAGFRSAEVMRALHLPGVGESDRVGAGGRVATVMRARA